MVPCLGNFEIGVDDAEEMAFRRVGALTAQMLELARQFGVSQSFTVQIALQ